MGQEVSSRRRDIDAASHDRRAVLRLHHRQRTDAIENVREQAFGADMQDDQDRGGQIAGQTGQELLQHVESACGSADDNDVVMGPRMAHGGFGIVHFTVYNRP